jgi:hypothetical protein
MGPKVIGFDADLLIGKLPTVSTLVAAIAKQSNVAIFDCSIKGINVVNG